ncbi:sialin-like isoform X2 [Lepeophtheirus salmonis]|uniref:sialin-like isoform X2 n=1 Tax=Lepeophtheirus salmonis TaxID=72036 RepID=UPI001AE5B33A|nr:sialin-like isoform X2 [Lepeophtheirus salmonis]
MSDQEESDSNYSFHNNEDGQDLIRTPEEENPGFGQRHVFTLLSFLGFANVYAMRVNLSVAIVAMTTSNNTNSSHQMGHECPSSGNLSFGPLISATLNYEEKYFNVGPKFDWSEEQKNLILGSFFYGYVLTQIPGGYLAEKYGGKWLFGLGTLSTAILTILTPLAASLGITALVVLRIIEGLAEGVTFPVMHALISKWIHKNERSKLGTIIWTGANFGTIISLPISGLLSNSFGWPWAFYSFGIIGIIWFIFWALFTSNSPETHYKISPSEVIYLASSSSHSNGGQNTKFPPLRKILTSPPFIAIIIAHFGQNWGNYTFLTELPTYLSSIQHFSLDKNGFLSALPFLLMWIMAINFGSISDYLIVNNKLSVGATRKLMNSIGTYAICCMCLSVGLSGAGFSGYQVNMLDLSSNYAGTLMGISNSIGNTCGFLVTTTVGLIINNNPTLSAWRTVFLINMGIYVVTNSIYLIFSSGKEQSWNTI